MDAVRLLPLLVFCLTVGTRDTIADCPTGVDSVDATMFVAEAPACSLRVCLDVDPSASPEADRRETGVMTPLVGCDTVANSTGLRSASGDSHRGVSRDDDDVAAIEFLCQRKLIV